MQTGTSVFSTTSDVKGVRLETPIPDTLAAQPAERKGVWKIKIPPGGGVPETRLSLTLIREDGTWSEDKGTPPPLQKLQKELPTSSTHPVTADW